MTAPDLAGGSAGTLRALPRIAIGIYCSPMSEIPSRLSAALADRYRLDRKLGESHRPDWW
jgi:hypothetical protein